MVVSHVCTQKLLHTHLVVLARAVDCCNLDCYARSCCVTGCQTLLVWNGEVVGKAGNRLHVVIGTLNKAVSSLLVPSHILTHQYSRRTVVTQIYVWARDRMTSWGLQAATISEPLSLVRWSMKWSVRWWSVRQTLTW